MQESSLFQMKGNLNAYFIKKYIFPPAPVSVRKGQGLWAMVGFTTSGLGSYVKKSLNTSANTGIIEIRVFVVGLVSVPRFFRFSASISLNFPKKNKLSPKNI